MDDLGRWSMPPVLRSFEFERIARQFEGRHLPDGDPEQPGEGVRLDPHVPASGYRNAQCPPRVPERVTFQDHAVALGHLEMRVRGAQVLKRLPLRNQAVDPGHVDAFQRCPIRESARLDPQLPAMRDLDFHRLRRNRSLK